MHIIFTVQLKNNCLKLSFQSYLVLKLNPTLISETSLQSKQWTVSLILLTYYLYWLCCIRNYLHFSVQLRSTHLVSKHTCNLHIFTHDCLFILSSNAYKSPGVIHFNENIADYINADVNYIHSFSQLQSFYCEAV